MTTTRDTQFAGFAKEFWEELEIALGFVGLEIRNKNFHEHIQKIIAKRAYDLVDHTVCSIDPLDFQCYSDPYEFIINSVPDMTKFPELQPL